MNFMILSISGIYIYWMIIRDFLTPLAYSVVYARDQAQRQWLLDFANTQSSVLGILLYITSLLFLGMYFYFANNVEEPST